MDIIQIGANRGSDDLTQLIFENKNRLGKIILVEPMSHHHELLRECYNDIPIIIEGIAITDDPKLGKMPLYYSLQNAPHFEVASFSKEHVLKCGFGADIMEKEVICMTINQLMEKHKLDYLDILFIDAEGLDDRIIKSINFKKYKIKTIIYENLHTLSNERLIHFLSRKGYYTIVNWGQNGWSNMSMKQKFSLKFTGYKIKVELQDFRTRSKALTKKNLKKWLIQLGLFKYYKFLQNRMINKQNLNKYKG